MEGYFGAVDDADGKSGIVTCVSRRASDFCSFVWQDKFGEVFECADVSESRKLEGTFVLNVCSFFLIEFFKAQWRARKMRKESSSHAKQIHSLASLIFFNIVSEKLRMIHLLQKDFLQVVQLESNPPCPHQRQ